MKFPLSRNARLGLAITLLLGAPSSQAAGFNVPEISVAGTALSNALAANPEIHGAVAYNPALAAFHKGTVITAGVNVVHAESTVSPTLGTPADFQGQDNVFIPNLHLTHQWNQDVFLGFSSSLPFGLSTNYPLGTFGTLAAFNPGAPLSAGALQPTKSKVEIVDMAPSVTFKLGQDTAIGVGVDYYWARKVVFDSQDVQNSGDGDGWGLNVSLAHVAGPWSVGASYRSRAVVDIQGTTVFGLLGATPAKAKLVVPWRAQIGIRYKASPALAIEADVSRTGWNSFDTLTISNAISPVVSTNQWDDSNAYRLSATYQLNNAAELRFGYTFDEKASGDAHFSARTADSDRHLFSLGFGLDLGNGLEVEGSYMLVRFTDRNFATTTPFGTYGSDANGTSAYNGNYETTVHIVGLGLSKRF
ncbi:MAG: aromatic hydrocarbon degradation protein [Gammaproteobacteria bacterium]|nr:MAG: aromatic hydrocarbon degradation protein [Gammaproteobacteria bacterium]